VDQNHTQQSHEVGNPERLLSKKQHISTNGHRLGETVHSRKPRRRLPSMPVSRPPAISIFLLLGLLSSCSAALNVAPPTLPEGKVGHPYQASIVVGDNETPLGGAYLESGSLPPGLSFGRVEQQNRMPIVGTPTGPGKHSFRVSLWCHGTNFPGQSATRDYVIVIR